MSDYAGAILAAGRGSRMGALGDYYPKPLLPVANEPLIIHHLRILRSLGIKEVYIVVGHKAAQIAQVVGEGSRHDMHITYVDQRSSLGSAHALRQLAPYIHGTFVLLLGDYYFSAPNLGRMIEKAEASGGFVMAAKREPNRQALCEACALTVDDQGRIVQIVEKPKSPASDLKGCGIYVFRSEIFDAVYRTPRTTLRDEYELTMSIDLYIQAGYPLYAEQVIEWDMNFTRPEDVLQCNLTWLERQGRQELVGTNVQLASGTRLEWAIAGDNVVVEKPSVLRRTVVFPGVQLKGGGLIERVLATPVGLIHCIGE